MSWGGWTCCCTRVAWGPGRCSRILGISTGCERSVCTGSLVYAAAGLLGGRPATTHWASLGLLAELDPTIEVRGDDRFVDDGEVVTSAGVSAGIDMALHVLARLGGIERAKEIRRYIQYDPLPPV